MKTNGGYNWQAAQMGGTPGAVAVHVGLTANITDPAVTDTTLTGEITTAGLTRKAGGYAHTTSATSYTITTLFTAVSADVPVTVAKRGIFTAVSGGTLVFTQKLNPAATLSTAGDTLTITDVIAM